MWRTLITKQRKYSRLNTSTRGYELYKRCMMRKNNPNRVCVGLKRVSIETNVVKKRRRNYLETSLAMSDAAAVADETFLACARAAAWRCRAARSSAQSGFEGTLPTRLVKTFILYFRNRLVSHSTATQCWRSYAPSGLFLVIVGPEQDILPVIKQQAEGSRHDAHIAVEVLRPSRWCRRSRACDGILVIDSDDFAQVDGEYRLLGHGVPGDQIATDHLEVTSSRDLRWASRQLDAFADLI
jgi:hypothetical protein